MEKNHKNVIEVEEPSSKLEIFFEDYDPKIFFGQIKKLKIILKNVGKNTIKKILFTNSNAQLFGHALEEINCDLGEN